MAPPACAPPGPVVLTRHPATNKFQILWGAGDPNRIGYQVALEVLNTTWFPTYETIEGAAVGKNSTKHTFRFSRPGVGDTVRANVRTVCKDCKESDAVLSNELGPY